jgi:hypothetical protein
MACSEMHTYGPGCLLASSSPGVTIGPGESMTVTSDWVVDGDGTHPAPLPELGYEEAFRAAALGVLREALRCWDAGDRNVDRLYAAARLAVS